MSVELLDSERIAAQAREVLERARVAHDRAQEAVARAEAGIREASANLDGSEETLAALNAAHSALHSARRSAAVFEVELRSAEEEAHAAQKTAERERAAQNLAEADDELRSIRGELTPLVERVAELLIAEERNVQRVRNASARLGIPARVAYPALDKLGDIFAGRAAASVAAAWQAARTAPSADTVAQFQKETGR